VSQTIGTRY